MKRGTSHLARRRLGTLCCVGALAAIAVAASSSTASSSTGKSSSAGKLAIVDFNPFTGPDASYGPYDMAGCLPAVRLINMAGGVLGHELTCKPVDTRGDPADAVPAARQFLAATSNLVAVLGPSSDEATAIVPIINQAKIPMFADTGQAAFDHSTFPYFWRNEPADDDTGYAMAIFAHRLGFKRAAAIFGSNQAAQGTLPTVLKAFPKLGGSIVINEELAAGQPSYEVEVERMLAAKPQVIFTEADPQTTATFLAELQQLSHLIPIIGSGATQLAPWFSAVSKAISPQALSKSYVGAPVVDAASSGAAWRAFMSSLLAANVPQAHLYLTDPTAQARYDAVNVIALAMLAANSTDPVKLNQKILAVTAPRPGAVVVPTFAAGKAALKAGKSIQYVGPTGPELFNRWHNTSGGFTVLRWTPAGHTTSAGAVSAAQVHAMQIATAG